MKKIALSLMFVALIAACGQNNRKAGNADEQLAVADPNIVQVYYFHGKERCKTCIAVGDIALKTVENAYTNNPNVRFIEINTSEESAKALVKKYEVTWNALIIAKGNNSVDITQQAFATALGNPQSLENLIKDEVNKRL